MALQPRAQPLDLAQISLRHKERGFVVGGVDSGKSTLMDLLSNEFVHRYRTKKGRRLYVDSKPRARAEWLTNGLSADRRYKQWGHGQPLADSVVVDDPDDIDRAFRKHSTVVVQAESSADIPRLVASVRAFLQKSNANRPQILHVDETLDFFHGNGMPRGGDDALIRAPRAGRERGTACLFGAQRTKGMSPTIMEEMSRLYCLRIDSKSDVKVLPSMGAPITEDDMPMRPHEFVYWWKGDYRNLHGPYKLSL